MGDGDHLRDDAEICVSSVELVESEVHASRRCDRCFHLCENPGILLGNPFLSTMLTLKVDCRFFVKEKLKI